MIMVYWSKENMTKISLRPWCYDFVLHCRRQLVRKTSLTSKGKLSGQEKEKVSLLKYSLSTKIQQHCYFLTYTYREDKYIFTE